jgi:DNA-binding MarR family transcriptional regulator
MTTQAQPTPAAEVAAGAEPLDELRLALSRLLGAERRLRSREHAPGELTHAHIRSRHTLAEQGEMTAGQLAKSADLNPASVTAMLDLLEQSGIVARSRSTTDRRVTNVALTPEGREVLAEKSARWQERWREALGRFSDEELTAAANVTSVIGELFDSLIVEKERAAARS